MTVATQLARELHLPEDLCAELGRITAKAERSRFLDRHPELENAEIVTALAERIPTIIKTRPSDDAKALAESALIIAGRLHDAKATALALRAKANVLHVIGDNKAAVRHHDRARSLFRKSGDATQVARTLSASIQPLILLGEYDRAYKAAAEASSIFAEQGNEWRLARVELNTGNIFDRQDRFREALDCYERAYSHLVKYRDRDPEGVAVVLHNIAGCLVLLNDFRGAEAAYENARAFAASNQMHVLVGQADYNLAWLHYLRGEYSRSIAMLRTTRDACEQNRDHYHFALCDLDLSEIHLELNMCREAAESADAAQRKFHELAMRYEEGKSLSNLGIALGQLGRSEDSSAAFRQGREIFRNEKNLAWCSLIDLYQAVALYTQQRDSEAKPLASSALKFFQSSALTSKAVLCHILLARIQLRSGHLPYALRECTRARKHLAKLESPALGCQVFALMGEIERLLGRTAQAYGFYQQAKDYLERLRNGISGEELKISFMRDRWEIYEGLVSLCIHKGPDANPEAFAYVEQAKSRSLFDMMAMSGNETARGNEAETKVTRRIRELREELNWYYRRAELEQLGEREHAAEQAQELRAKSRECERELLRLVREQSQQSVDPSALVPGASLSARQVQESLNPNATILEYFQIHDQLIAMVVTRDRVELVQLGRVDALEQIMQRLRFQMAKLRLGPDYVATMEEALLRATQNHLLEMYQHVLEPLRSQLRTAHLVIVPHGCLHHLPFQALFDGQNYLVDEFAISYAPSASIYTACERRGGNRTGRALVLGIPDPAIPLVEEEAAAVAETLPDSDLIAGTRATAGVLAEQGGECRFIHIATHGYFREDQPMFSGIRLVDSYLSLYDLYQLRLPVELVTLSGCSTGLNVVSTGDEILGLVRGLICAGVQSSLVTLWDVQDRSTTEFMKAFYACIVEGKNKAEAVREATLRLRKSYRHPYYWAPFVLVGKVFEASR
jgi:CHAT domain-containing protein